MDPIYKLWSSMRIALTAGSGFFFLILVGMLTTVLRPDILAENERPRFTTRQDLRPEYDFVVVGGGSAGAVLASRLSEVQEWSVLLIEAGGDETVLSDIPLVMPGLQRSALDWGFKTVKQGESCQGLRNGVSSWPRGKVLGGSSTINAMLYVRGNPRDYDHWGQDNPGWSYKQVLKYFLKSEDVRIDALKNSKYHRQGGYLTIENFRYNTKIAKSFLKAGMEMGYDIRDYNGKNQTGFSLPQATVRDGLRCSTAKAFLRPCRDRDNLHILINTQVERVLIDPSTKSATGVVFDHGKKQVLARKEVILSAGAIQSPQLLMLSGIGPREHLEEVGVTVLVDSPGVGQNLQDHVAVGGIAHLINESFAFTLPRILNRNTIGDFLFEHKGPLYGLPGCEVMAFIHTKYSERRLNWPDIQLFLASYGDNTDGGVFVKRDEGLTDDVYTAMFEPIVYKDTFTILPLLLRPKSRGVVKLNTSDPYHSPIIDPKYFQHPDDLKVLIEGAKFAHRLALTPTMKRLDAKINHICLPACCGFAIENDEYWMCQAKQYTMTIYHPVGTCKMGPKSDKMAVVDETLRVRGVRRLRVVDASIMPTITSGNTNAPTIMIAEKAGDMIRQDWSKQSADA